MAGAVFTMIGWSQTWVTLTLHSGEIQNATLSATGQASTVLPAGLALITFATALVLLTAGRVLAYVIAVINLATSVGLFVLAYAFLADPVSFELKQLSALTGIADSGALHALVSQTEIGFGFFFSVFGAVVTFVGAALIVSGARTWRSQRSRYQAAGKRTTQNSPNSDFSTLDAWDEMTQGTDPTS